MNSRNNLFDFLEQLPTEDLDLMLQSELQKEIPDENATRLILNVLRDRDGEQNVTIDSTVEAAWEKYQIDTELPKRKPEVMKNWIFRGAAAAAVICIILLTVPQSAKAGSFVGMLTRWTDNIFEFFDPRDRNTNTLEYEFKTDHPGLQQVYDAVVEMGVTDPVVPMWLPEGYVLVDCKIVDSPVLVCIYSCFSNGQKEIVFELNKHSQNVATEYHKDRSNAKQYECNGVIHYVFQNENVWTAAWTRDNMECFLTIDCQEDILRKILDSIYSMEE